MSIGLALNKVIAAIILSDMYGRIMSHQPNAAAAITKDVVDVNTLTYAVDRLRKQIHLPSDLTLVAEHTFTLVEVSDYAAQVNMHPQHFVTMASTVLSRQMKVLPEFTSDLELLVFGTRIMMESKFLLHNQRFPTEEELANMQYTSINAVA